MERQIIIAGQGRAGTTLFYNMMRHTLEGFMMPETEITAAQTINLAGNFCTKRPLDIFFLNDIMGKNARRKRVDLILTIRDPRDILLSKHKAVPDDYFISADKTYLIGKDRAPERTMPGLIDFHAASIAALNSGMFHQGVFILRYENLVDDPERVQRLLEEGLGLEFKGSFQDFHKGEIPQGLQGPLNGIRPVDQTSTQKWKRPESAERIVDQFERFPQLHDILKQLDYEKDDQWLRDLKASQQ